MRTIYIDFGLVLMIAASLVVANIPRTDVTVSGCSSGAAMASQMHIAFSKDISGCGILAGAPYYCAANGLRTNLCMLGPSIYLSVSALLSQINSYVSSGSIDSSANIANDRVYIFSGVYDTVQSPGVVRLNQQLYSQLGALVKTNFNMLATHGFPTNNYGTLCATLNAVNYIISCNINMAYDMLNYLYGGNLIRPQSNPTTPLVGQLLLFEQQAFMNFPSTLATGQSNSSALLQWISTNMALYYPVGYDQIVSGFFNLAMPNIATPLEQKVTTTLNSSIGFDKHGFVYFPSACTTGANCSIHVALHGCHQGRAFIQDMFVTKTGYLEIGELNNIIIIFPQIVPTLVSPTNPMGCWDWWGYSSSQYATRAAPQTSGIKKMIDTVRAINKAFLATK